jgi:hypothetical protein
VELSGAGALNWAIVIHLEESVDVSTPAVDSAPAWEFGNRPFSPSRSNFICKKTILFSLTAACSMVLTGASADAQLLIGVNFPGRINFDPQTPASILTADDVAGVIPQSNFNNVPFDLQQQGNATTGVLNDSLGVPTAVTLSFTSNDSWNTNAVQDSVINPIRSGQQSPA